jgi:SAM-dependent methyltransferase
VDQHTRGVHRLLSSPWIYRAYQRVIGARTLHRAVVALLDVEPGSRVLDIGCGPADLLDHLGDVEYTGFDVSDRYIRHARRRFGTRGSFRVADVTEVDSNALGTFDVVIAHGIVHHVSDEAADRIFDVASDALTPTGRFVTVDGCFEDGQSRLARFFVSRDRGRMIRRPDQYQALAERSFGDVEVQLHRSLLRIPYTLAILRCERPLPRRVPQ